MTIDEWYRTTEVGQVINKDAKMGDFPDRKSMNEKEKKMS